ncbi:hypothetical protein J6Y73_05265 [bacterium]|nr:hypothetical protein [bacterium]
MKKLLTLLVVLSMALILPAFNIAYAQANDSIENTGLPVVGAATQDGKTITYSIMSVEDAKNDSTNPLAVSLIEANEELNQALVNGKMDYAKIDTSLEETLSSIISKIDESYSAEDFIPKYLFELSVEDGILNENTNRVSFTFENVVSKGKMITVIHKDLSTNKWKVVPEEHTVVKGNNLEVEFSSLCPVAFLEVSLKAAPKPNILTYSLIGVSALLIIFASILTFKKKKK